MNKKILVNEQKNLKKVQNIVNSNIKVLLSKISNSNETIQNSLEYINSNKLDSIEKRDMFSFINNKHEIVSTLTRHKDFLIRIKPKPFFAKIVFAEKDGIDELYYVGLKNISSGENPVVIDWRVPMASLLYFSSLGKTYYDAPSGEIHVNLKLKRQFQLAPDKILSYIDTDTKIDDNFLQDVLSQNASSYMHNIVQTIQEEQNKIIRRPPNQSIIIDGVAGSGKTSIALHRISYILYCNRGLITSKNILVVSPNKLFGSYISELLPELGEENVYSCSMTQMFRDSNLLPKKFGSKMEMIERGLASKSSQEKINLKYSISFFDEVCNYLKDFDIRPYVLEACKDKGYPVNSSIANSIKIQDTSNLKLKIENFVHMVLLKGYSSLPYRYVEKMEKQILKHLKNIITPNLIYEKLYAYKRLNDINYIEYEDAPIYAFINYKLNGCSLNKSIQHIFVDEMQDYDPFSLYLIKQLFPDAVMTFAGDYNQNILSTSSNIEMLNRLYPEITIDKLDVSYRSTFEITSFSQNIIGKSFCYNFVRHGDLPEITTFDSLKNLQADIQSISDQYPNDKIAIVVKNLAEAKKISKIAPNFNLITDDTDQTILTSKRIITTTFLSKGLEYDRVIIPFVDKNNYSTYLEKQSLYVACTRALHGLHLFYDKNSPPCFNSSFLENLTIKKNNK